MTRHIDARDINYSCDIFILSYYTFAHHPLLAFKHRSQRAGLNSQYHQHCLPGGCSALATSFELRLARKGDAFRLTALTMRAATVTCFSAAAGCSGAPIGRLLAEMRPELGRMVTVLTATLVRSGVESSVLSLLIERRGGVAVSSERGELERELRKPRAKRLGLLL